jgi:hypothetical protein
MKLCDLAITQATSHEKGEREESLRNHGQYAMSRSGTDLVTLGVRAFSTILKKCTGTSYHSSRILPARI